MPPDTHKFNIRPAYSKPHECRGCPLEHDGTGFAIPDGTGSLRVLILGEALGLNEAKDGLGFRPYAPAGSVLERAFRSCGFNRSQFVIFNIVNCFVSPRAGVLTPDGYKEMSKISIGDLVMTHVGRFRKVLQKISNHDRVQRYKITVQPDIYQTGMNRSSTTPIHVTVTEDHLFLNANGWKPVQNFKAGHRIRLLAEKCIECATPFVRHFKKYGKSMAFCSVKCHNIFAARKGADKMREILLDAYRTGKRDPYAVTKAANEGMRKLLTSGWRPERGANAVAKQRVAMALTREAMGHAIGKGLWVGDAERKFAAMLDGAEIDYSTQFSIGGYSFDFKIGKLLVEIDGSSHNNFETDVIDFIKQRLARLEGYSVLRVNENQLESVFALLLNDAHDYAFEDVEVIDVTRATDRAGAYTLSVEEDNSYVAQGFVNHNCLPPSMELSGTPYEIAAAQHCRVHLKKVIEQYRPKVILALGAVALRSLTGYAGKKQSIEHMRGFALHAPEFPDIPVVTSYHPSYIVRGVWNVYPVLCRDLRYAVSIARNGFNPMPVEYIEHGTVNDLKYLIQICSSNEPAIRPAVLSADWETEGNPNAYEDEQLMQSLEQLYGEAKANKKTKKARERLGTEQRVTQLNVSVKEGQSFVFQAEPELMQWAKRLLALDIPKVGHNSRSYDVEVGIYNDMPWEGIVDDTMLMFHHLYPDVPGRRGKMDAEGEDGSFANLQYCASFYGFDFPWKHLVDEQPEFYGAADSDACLRLYNRLIPDMQSVSHPETGITVWDSYCTLVADLWPILQGASKRGMPVNRVKILEFLNSVVNRQRTLGAEIQRIIPRELLPTKQKTGLKKSPKDTTGYELREFSISSSDERCKCFRVRKKDVEKYMALDGAEISERDGKFRAPDAECDVCGATGWVHYPDRVETRWCKLLEFNPNSPVQMKQYANFHHHKIPKNKDKKYAMDKWTLDQLVRTTRDPLYRSTIDYRQFEKMSAYAIGWMPKEDGRVHPEFSYYPATGQLSSFNPNCFSDDTEVLTENGWMLFPDFVHNQCRVAEFDKADWSIRFTKPEAVINRRYRGDMVNITTEQHIDMLVTPDHDCLLRNRHKGNWCKYQAAVYPSDWLQYNAGNYVGGEVTLSKHQIILICALQADGHVTKSGAYDFVFKKERKIKRLKGALKALGIPFKVNTRISGGKRFYISGSVIPEWRQGKKFFGRWLLDLTRACFKFMATEVYFWDGHWASKSMYSSSHKINADWVQIVTALTGRRARIREYWNGNPNSCINYQVDATNKPYSLTTNLTRKYVAYDSRVYCVTMPLGTVITRRNNVVAVTGNCQNMPSLSKYGPLAQELRDGVEAPDGYVIVEIDLKSFHAQTLGYEAKCPAYIRLAKLDVHSYVAGNMLKLPHFDYCLEWEDDELLTFLKWHRKNYTCPDGTPFQKVRDERAKVGVLAFGLGQMAGSLFTSNRDSFLPNWYLDRREKNESLYDTDHKRADKEGLKAAQLVHDALNERFPELRLYRENTPLVIKKQGGRAVSRYGCVRWFWDIQHWDGRKSEFVHGTDWEKAISFYVQNDGHGYLKYALLRAQALGYLEKYGFVNTVHDSIVFCCRAELRDECIVNMTEELTRPSEVLTFDDGSGLSIGAESKAGRTWGDMKEVVV